LKSGKWLLPSLLAMFGAILAAHAELSSWVQHEPAGPLLQILLRSVPMPGGAVQIRRPPSETRPALTAMIGADAKNAALYRLRAQEAELQLDFVAAETDWRRYADLLADRGQGYLDLADYYHRRANATGELSALEAVGRAPSDSYLPVTEQRAWLAFSRMLPVIKDAGLPALSTTSAFREWIARYPAEQSPRQEYLGFLIDQRSFTAAELQIAAYRKAFPADDVYPTEAEASLASQRESDEAAIGIYDRAFQPSWPKALTEAWFKLLDDKQELREFEGRARTALRKDPGDLNAAARLVAYYQHAGNMLAAKRVLLEYRIAKESKLGSWRAAELKTVATLFAPLQDINEQARAYYALYSFPGVRAEDKEAALAGLASLLLERPDEPMRFGSGDLSFYKDIASADSSPGFLNGILSLVLNSTTPRWQYQQQNDKSVAYFHRAAGAQLLQALERDFPNSPHRAALRASMVDAYVGYGDDADLITAGQSFLTTFGDVPQRTHVSLAVADALARQHREQEEFAVYQKLLRELATRAGGVPLGVHGSAAPAPNPNGFGMVPNASGFGAIMPIPQTSHAPGSGSRSPDYATVLDRYLARLGALNRPMDALRVYRDELAQDPNDPGLYARFAGFLEQNNISADVQDVYRRAIAKFPDKSWYHRLARWYLRSRQQSAYASLTQEVTGIFTGTELESYFSEVVQTGPVAPNLYLQLNLFAHQRFPEDLVFVRNLLREYQSPANRSPAAAASLLHDYWFCDDDLRRQFFEQLSQGNQIYNQLTELRRDHPEIEKGHWQQLETTNPAAVQFDAEAETWLGHYEAAAPPMRALADAFPGREDVNLRTAALHRSLAVYFGADTGIAAALAERAWIASPRNTGLIDTIGDIYSDRDQFTKAAAAWNRIPQVFPGKRDGYLEAATVYWDYYLFTDALRLIGQARLRYHDNKLFAYEAGAIWEGRRNYTRAISEYLAADTEVTTKRIVRLASRPAYRDLVYRLTANAYPDVRVAVLEAQQRRPELEAYLSKQIALATHASDLAPLLQEAQSQGFDAVQQQVLDRQIGLTIDPIERMRLRIDLAKYFEGRKDVAASSNTLNALYNDYPLVLGVVRARVDFDKRNKRGDDAITTLTAAASKARPDLSAQFRFEAARVATDALKIDQARVLLSDLLKTDPWRADYLAQMAETYAAANDDAGFIQYARMEIDALRKSPLDQDDRNTRVAALRRRLIATLARRNDYQGALDQYVEVIDTYPDDQAVLREAALFVAAHALKPQLVAFYSKTIASAPRDWRWPIVLARIETVFEDYPAALDAYDKAMKERPDRADIVEARAALEVRLLRFDTAITSYTRLYGLTYNDPQWLEKVAELEARLGRKAEAIAALERANIGAGGETVSALFGIADSLDSFKLYSDAARYAERGFTLAGNDLWTKYPAYGASYAKIMAENRRTTELLALRSQSPDAAARANALQRAGVIVALLYTPEEKAELAARLSRLPVQTDDGLLRLAQSAGLEDIVAQATRAVASRPQYIARQSERALYGPLSRELEADGDNIGAASAARSEGDTATEISNLDYLRRVGRLNGLPLQRYLALLAAADPARLLSLAASGSEELRNQAVQSAISGAAELTAVAALRARSTGLPPVWLSAYTALTGVYFGDRSPAVNQAFLTALHPATIGQRLAAKPDPNQTLAGSVWYYYGARYGEYLAGGNTPGASDYLPAQLESTPGDPEAYMSLGNFYAEHEQTANAIREFYKALDLDADRGEAYNGIAVALMKDGKRADAVTEWRDAIAAFEREQGKGVRVRDSFWSHVGAAIGAVSQADAFPDLRDNIHHLLADYVHRNGSYRLNELLAPALRASIKTDSDFNWLTDIIRDSWINVYQVLPDATPQQQEQFARFKLTLTLRQVALTNGAARAGLEEEAVQERAELINLLLASGNTTEAETEWNQFTDNAREAPREQLTAVEIRLAGATGTISQLIARYRALPDRAPFEQILLYAATTLRQDHQIPAALSLLEYTYRRDLENQDLNMAGFLGLSEVLLEQGDTSQAVETLRRMILVATEEFNVANEPFGGYIPAADVLLRFHRNSEAAEFLSKAIEATPWEFEARLKLAQISDAAARRRLALGIVADASATYESRAEAARLLTPAQVTVPGELALLAARNITEAAAQKPFYVEARQAAARSATDPALRMSLLREALAFEPGNRAVRLDAVRAALGAGKDSLALAMFRYLSGNGVIAPLQEADVLDQTTNERFPQSGFAPVILTNGLDLSAMAQMQLYEELVVAAERTGNLPEALGFLNNARSADMGATDRQRLAAKRDAIRADQQRLIENSKRAPLITGKVEQAQIVKPRIAKEAQ